MAESYRDLLVWQRSIELSMTIYRLTQGFPKEELFGLTSQVRRAGVSVASNIADGRGRLNPGEFRQFLGIALGSTFEIQTQLLVARRMEMGTEKALGEAAALSDQVSKMLTSFIQTLSSKPKAKS